MGQCGSKQAINLWKERKEHVREQQRQQRQQQLLDSIENGDLDRFRELYLLLKPDVNEAMDDASIPLHFACRTGKLEIAQYLADEEEADVDLQDRMGWTPLHHASYHGRLDVAKWLVLHTNASAQIADADGETPLHKLKSVDFKAQPGEDANPNDMFLLMRLLIEKGGADPTSTNHEGYTLLQLVKQIHARSRFDNLPFWVRNKKPSTASYGELAECDYDLDLESTAESSVACSTLSLSRYHIYAESDVDDDADWYAIDGSDDDEEDLDGEFDCDIGAVHSEYDSNGKAARVMQHKSAITVKDWLAYLNCPVSDDVSSIEATHWAEKIPLTPDTSLDDDDETFNENYRDFQKERIKL